MPREQPGAWLNVSTNCFIGEKSLEELTHFCKEGSKGFWILFLLINQGIFHFFLEITVFFPSSYILLYLIIIYV